MPEFSTKTRHWQLSLRTTGRSIACIIARRLNYECDRMLDAITDGKLTPAQAKAWLTSVVRSELDRIERQRMISRMDPRKTGVSIGRRRAHGPHLKVGKIRTWNKHAPLRGKSSTAPPPRSSKPKSPFTSPGKPL
ncbi:hypothetical protein GGQ68_001678 [Sagittula marina]|uniref:Uncharacterized protein n=1 Tax=Sagittula marina TaxID=943940 RepID=A0A7W6DUB5_9RHOB|nr:hypothetical protein [Sagittula marina]